MKDSDFLTFIAARFVEHYHEDQNVDFVLHLKELAVAAKEREDKEELGYLVHLTYFKESGKAYTEGKYRSTQWDLQHIWDEVKKMLDNRELPGLIKGHDAFQVLVHVPLHPLNVQQLISPLTMSSKIKRPPVAGP